MITGKALYDRALALQQQRARYGDKAGAADAHASAQTQALNHWMRDFLAIARIALADQPQRLTKLGAIGA